MSRQMERMQRNVCNPVNPAPKQSKSPKAQDDLGLSPGQGMVE